jgi:hypothetical protein
MGHYVYLLRRSEGRQINTDAQLAVNMRAVKHFLPF